MLTGPQGGGLLVDNGSAAPASSTGAAASLEPQLALRSLGARKWGPAQFAPQSQPAVVAAAAPTSATGEGITPLHHSSYIEQCHPAPEGTPNSLVCAFIAWARFAMGYLETTSMMLNQAGFGIRCTGGIGECREDAGC
jgi:hypothetical protein